MWAIREPNAGVRQRLALNSLTGANLAAHKLRQMKRSFQFIYGNPDEKVLVERLEDALVLAILVGRLRSFTVAALGDAPDGFHFSTPSQTAVQQLGIRVVHIDLNDTFQRALALGDDEVIKEVDRVHSQVRGISSLPQDSVQKFAKLQHVLYEEIVSVGAQAVAVRCWPEFFTEFGAAACSTLSSLTEDGVMGACEADIFGALSMDVLYQLTRSPAYLGDLVELDESNGAMVFWHCGAGAFSLARSDTGAEAGVHPNRQIGFTLEFGLRPGPVTIFRLGEDRDGCVRALIGEGDMLDQSQRFLGTSGMMRLTGDGDPFERLMKVLEAGFEPHYAIGYGRVANQLERLCAALDVPVTRF